VSKWTEKARSKNSINLEGSPLDITTASDEQIIEALKALPNGLSGERTRVTTDWKYTPQEPASIDEFAGYDASNAFRESQNETDILKAIEHYEKAAASYDALGAKQPAANMYSLAGQAYLELKDNPFDGENLASEKAIMCFEKAIDLHNEQGHYDFSYRDRNTRYNAMAETAITYQQIANNPQNKTSISSDDARNYAHTYEKMLEPEAKALAQKSSLAQGRKDKTALRVEQKEIGFSDSAPVGTDNLGQCVAVAVQSAQKDEKLTALAHIDYGTDPASISKIFDRMPDGTKKVRIVGARFDEDEKSQHNLCNVVRELSKHDVDIISANVHQGNLGASAVVLSPDDFEFTEAVPVKNHQYADAACAHPLLIEDKPLPMRIAFDASKEAASPMLLDNFIVHDLKEHYVGKTYVEKYQTLKNQGFHDLGLASHNISALESEYQRELSAMKQKMPDSPDELLTIVDNAALFIGHNADTNNQQLANRLSAAYENAPNKASFGSKQAEKLAHIVSDDMEQRSYPSKTATRDM